MARAVRFLVLFGCGFEPISPAAQPLLNGVWRSQGYAYVFEIRGPDLKAFEVTATTCVLGFTAQLQRVAGPGREATFKSKDEGVFFIRTGGTDDHKLIHREEAVPDIGIDRIESLVAVGTAVSPCPPHSPVLALLVHKMCSSTFCAICGLQKYVAASG